MITSQPSPADIRPLEPGPIEPRPGGSRAARPPVIVSIEDNRADQRLLEEVFRGLAPDCRLEFFCDGMEALKELRARAAGGGGLPGLILLDLNLPRLDGSSVLRELRRDPQLAGVPVMLLTTSASGIELTRENGGLADDFFLKPCLLDGYDELVRRIRSFLPEHSLLSPAAH